MLEQQPTQPRVAVQRLAVEQGRVALWVGYHPLDIGEHDVAEAPDARGRRVQAPALAGVEALDQLVAGESGRAVLQLQQAAAHRAAGAGVVHRQLVAAFAASLPGRRPVRAELHRPVAGSLVSRAPRRSTAPTTDSARRPPAAWAATIAAATRSARSRPRARANAVGPLPEIELPSAPASSAAALASAKPGRSAARAGSAIRSSIARPSSS